MWVKALIGCCLLAVCYGQDTSVCTSAGITPPPSVSGQTPPLKPNISAQFHTRIEVVIKNKNQTQTFHEWFDSTNNRGYMEQIYETINYGAWYDYATNEFIGLFRNAAPGTPGACSVTDLSTSDQRYLLGYQVVNNQPRIFSAAGALHWAGQNINEVYMGQTTIRDIKVDWWRSCQYWANMDATMLVDWYFTVRDNWVAAADATVPVQCHVTGTSTQKGKHSFEHYYNFYEFRPYIKPDETRVFETPSGIVCPGRKLTQNFPTVANDAFSFTTEILDVTNNHLSFMKETFFYSQKLVKYEYRPQLGDYAPYGYNDLIEIHDFRSGVAYVTDKRRGNCSYRQIEGSDFDDRSSGPNTVRIRNSKEFFYFDVSKKATSYEGVKKNRNVDCDTWIATRSDFPFTFPSNSTWEWYFASNNWQFANAGPETGAIPMQMRISIPDRSWNFQYNLYNFKKDKPDLLNFDISGCYPIGQRRKFQFMLNVTSDVKSLISSNMGTFKYYVLQSVVSATGVSPVRVANLQAFIVDVIIVTFELLDVSPITGDVKKSTSYTEVTLNYAANTVAQMIQNGQFVVSLGGDVFMNKALVAIPNSIVEITYLNQTTTVQNQKQTGYGPGPMAAVGITMPLAGAGLGIVFAYFFFK
ncbi:uncharacterized protein LOC128221230 [Mya arenaria]|uniref:uncharacterized protein LOC128221230 n=1 Tax=Mya arenaria TaxID=6604 RepID=UPI0022E30C68|nr:uncharacterized protein LOC128221230 [Mya arenaria]XP_052785714.1 uncharacterized protein LOC128221230 [Mya arenaria]